MSTTGPDALLTVEEIAAKLRLSEAWVRQHASGARRPHLPGVKLGKLWRFRDSAIQDWLKKMEAEC